MWNSEFEPAAGIWDDLLATMKAQMDQIVQTQSLLAAQLAAKPLSNEDEEKENRGGTPAGKTPSKRGRNGEPRRQTIDKTGWKTCPHCERKVSPKNGHTPAQCKSNPENVERAKAAAKDPE